MQVATNISITRSAAAILTRQRGRIPTGVGTVLAMIYIEFFREPDGTPVKGFVPGYQAGSWPSRDITPDWLFTRLPDGTQFYLLPRFKWSPRDTYRMDLVGGPFALFSIERQ